MINYHNREERYNKFNNIIEIYAELLNDETRLLLNIDNNKKVHMFNYCCYMTELDVMELYIVASNWTMYKINNEIGNYDFDIANNKSWLLIYELFKLFIVKCENLLYFSFDNLSCGKNIIEIINTNNILDKSINSFFFDYKGKVGK